MSSKPIAVNYTENSRLWFPEGVAPFDELNLVRIDHTLVREGDRYKGPNTTLEMGGRSILREAWAQSEWLRQVISDEDRAAFAERKLDDDLDEVLIHDIIRAAFHPNKQAAWFAVAPPSYELDKGEAIVRGLGSYLAFNQVVGFANAKHDVSGSTYQRAMKRWRHPEKVYAAVSNVDVVPKRQGEHIGAALFYSALGMFGPDQRPTTYVAALNRALMLKLYEAGYQPTGSYVRTNLIPGVEIEEVRMQAKSVEAVRGHLEEVYPWLIEAVQVYRGKGSYDI